jgi:hypothetical protein
MYMYMYIYIYKERERERENTEREMEREREREREKERPIADVKDDECRRGSEDAGVGNVRIHTRAVDLKDFEHASKPTYMYTHTYI